MSTILFKGKQKEPHICGAQIAVVLAKVRQKGGEKELTLAKTRNGGKYEGRNRRSLCQPFAEPV